MFALKKKYYLIIESIKDIDLSNIKKKSKFNIIYRYKRKHEKIEDLINFRRSCRCKSINFFIANNAKLATKTNADGIYISAFNKDLSYLRLKKSKKRLIGSAHNIKELNHKILQGCENVIVSRLFKTNYTFKSGNLGVVRFNFFGQLRKISLTALGGIKLNNLNKLKMLESDGIALLSEIKKKPVIANRLF